MSRPAGDRALLADGGRLRQAYVDLGLACRQIAELAGVSARTVSVALRRAGVPRRPPGPRPGLTPLLAPLDDAAWLHGEYALARRSVRQVAERAGASRKVVERALLTHGLVARRGGYRDLIVPQLDDAGLLRDLLVGQGLTVAQVGRRLGVPAAHVRAACVRHGVVVPRSPQPPVARRKRHPRLWDEDWLRRQREAGMGVTAVARLLGCAHSEVSRAFVRYGIAASGRRRPGQAR